MDWTFEGKRTMAEHAARDVADFFLRRAHEDGKTLTAIQVLNLVYFAHGWGLAISGDALVKENVVASEYGPVIRPVYDAFKVFGNKPIRVSVNAVNSEFSSEETDLLEKVWRVFGPLKGFQLSGIAHRSDSPWAKIYNNGGGLNAVIPNHLIEESFKAMAAESESNDAGHANAAE